MTAINQISFQMRDRAVGALFGLAIGDALGMPTQSMQREQIADRYGRIRKFVDGARDQPVAPDAAAGSVTDDTEQAFLLADLLIEGKGHLNAVRLSSALLDWEAKMIRKGSLDLLGPSTKAALQMLRNGVSPEETGKKGTTNGAAMRIAPIGIAFPPGPSLREAIIAASAVTHNTGLGLSGAGAVGAAVSAAIEGLSPERALEMALDEASTFEKLGHWVAGASIPSRVRALLPITDQLEREELEIFLYTVVGTSVQSQESVVSALLLAARTDFDPFDALCTSASLGGDTDTIAAMTGAVLGALHGPDAFPMWAREKVVEVNELNIHDVADKLIELRVHP